MFFFFFCVCALSSSATYQNTKAKLEYVKSYFEGYRQTHAGFIVFVRELISNKLRQNVFHTWCIMLNVDCNKFWMVLARDKTKNAVALFAFWRVEPHFLAIHIDATMAKKKIENNKMYHSISSFHTYTPKFGKHLCRSLVWDSFGKLQWKKLQELLSLHLEKFEWDIWKATEWWWWWREKWHCEGDKTQQA